MIELIKYKNSTFLLDGDDDNYILIERKVNTFTEDKTILKGLTGEREVKKGDTSTTGSVIGYFSSLNNALKALLSLLIKRNIKDNGITSLNELMTYIKEQNELLNKIII